MSNHLSVSVSNEELSQWADKRADDAGRLARELIEYRTGKTLRQDVVDLVIAAREFWDANNDLSEESKALDKALEPFASKVRYANEPEASNV